MKYWTILLFSTLSLGLLAQNQARLIDWKLLSKVNFEDQYYPEYEAWYLVPKFSKEVKELSGQKVLIKGYVIPLDVDGGLYALSAYPFSACFFCGGAGPESVMSLKFKSKPDRFDTDDYLNFTGTFKLNDTNVEEFNYILENCELVE